VNFTLGAGESDIKQPTFFTKLFVESSVCGLNCSKVWELPIFKRWHDDNRKLQAFGSVQSH